ncbi:glycoside hydrolase family 88 protein [Fibrella aquatica]|uniref:glycoside hydrolase family 88 protein n=1 Tax=Fibrella aquatica TaxID=3242487 RepID=UPI00351FD6E9
MTRTHRLLVGFLFLSQVALAQSGSTNMPWSQRMLATIMANNRDSLAYVKEGKDARWEYEMGVILQATEQVWYRTADDRYFQYIQKNMDRYVSANGDIRTYKKANYNIDYITPGRSLLTLARQTLPGKEKYKKAADLLRQQLAEHPRTKEGGFWHKKIYPSQMWLDGLYMAEPFYAEYTHLYGKANGTEEADFNDIVNQFVWMEAHARDPKTGLLYHGWDESREQKWANKTTGQSPNFWSRAMGWYAMALVDVLDYIPQSHPRRNELIAILNRTMSAIVKFQDPASGCWYQVTNRLGDKAEGRPGNYLEASGSGMFVYAIAKGIRMGYLPASMMTAAKKGYNGMLKNFISTDEKGQIHLEKTVLVSGLGGNPYRDGSYEYYLSEKLRQDDLKGVGPFIMASVEMEIAAESGVGKGKTVAVDNYFNHEFRKAETGGQEPFHYLWDDRMHSGFYWWGTAFRHFGAKTTTIAGPPTAASLKGVDVYIIVDPDTPKETAKPNYVSPADSKAIADWVKAGGTLVLMANDTSNCEHKYFGQLAAQFGIQFLPSNVNMVQGTKWEQGLVTIPAGTSVFPETRSVYIKELAPIAVSGPAKALVTQSGNIIMATAKVGKGTVFAVGDPWLYNEYVDGRRIPAQYENFKAAKELASWLLK